MDDDGKPPEFNGFWLNGDDGRIVEIEAHVPNPNLDPACFPLLFPRGKYNNELSVQIYFIRDTRVSIWSEKECSG